MRSVYIHIPFCSSICSYCDFCKMIYNDIWAENYIKKLEEEIITYYEEDEVKSIYIGGGTPSALSNELLKKLLEILSNIKLSSKNEYTFEMNANDITEEKLKILKKYKINRISVGIESFNKYKLKFLNRKHKSKEIKNKIKLLRNYDFDNINVDFMYALPVENYKMFKRDLNKIIKLNPEHISTYSLIIEDNTVLGIKHQENIDENLDYKMYQRICKTLKNKGYVHYEISNFSKVGYESKHNLTYWTNDEYYAFGLGAHGFINNVRYENTKNLNSYMNNDYRKSEYFTSTKEDMENYVIFGLRKLSGINVKNFYEKYNKNIQDVFDLKEVMKDKFLILDGEYLKIPEKNIYVMNEILEKILK